MEEWLCRPEGASAQAWALLVWMILEAWLGRTERVRSGSVLGLLWRGLILAVRFAVRIAQRRNRNDRRNEGG